MDVAKIEFDVAHVLQLDPKEIARRREAEIKGEDKAVPAAKDAANMKKLSSFFKPIAKPS